MRLSRKRLHLQRAQLDALIGKGPPRRQPSPQDGWIRATRESLGMTIDQLAHRLGVSKSTALGLERSEARGAISIKSLQRAAAALGCELAYSLVPEVGSLERMIDLRTRTLAEKKVRKVAHEMALEGRPLPEDLVEAQVKETAAELKQRLPSELWSAD